MCLHSLGENLWEHQPGVSIDWGKNLWKHRPGVSIGGGKIYGNTNLVSA